MTLRHKCRNEQRSAKTLRSYEEMGQRALKDLHLISGEGYI